MQNAVFVGFFIKFFSLKRPLPSVTELAGIMEINFLCPLSLLSSSSFALCHLFRKLSMKNSSMKKLSLSRPFCRYCPLINFALAVYISIFPLPASLFQSSNPFYFALLTETPSSIPKGDASNAGIM